MAAENDPLSPLLAALGDLIGWLKAGNTPGIIIGGVAASILGRPRTTRDIDALVILADDQWGPFLRSSASHGFAARMHDALEFANLSRVLLLRHVATHVDVDISFGGLPFEEEAVRRQQVVPIGELKIPLTTPEDLIIMKAVANRPRDIADIESVVSAHPGLDVERIRFWMQQFGAALDAPDLWADLQPLLPGATTPRKRQPPGR